MRSQSRPAFGEGHSTSAAAIKEVSAAGRGLSRPGGQTFALPVTPAPGTLCKAAVIRRHSSSPVVGARNRLYHLRSFLRHAADLQLEEFHARLSPDSICRARIAACDVRIAWRSESLRNAASFYQISDTVNYSSKQQ